MQISVKEFNKKNCSRMCIAQCVVYAVNYLLQLLSVQHYNTTPAIPLASHNFQTYILLYECNGSPSPFCHHFILRTVVHMLLHLSLSCWL